MAHRKMKAKIPVISEIGVIDLILADHRYLKECIDILINDDVDKRKKLSIARAFLEAVEGHSGAEKKVIYAPLESNEELHFNILEAKVEHGILDKKIRVLKKNLLGARTLKDEVEVELKVFAHLLNTHLMEEESELLPKMKLELDEATLDLLGVNFMKSRKVALKEIGSYPDLEDELLIWKDSIQKSSREFLTKMDRYVENLKQ